MFDAILNPLAAGAVRHEKLLSSLAFAWFVLGWAAAANWIPLPKIPYFTDHNAWVGSSVWNAIWWGHLRPRILSHRAAGEFSSLLQSSNLLSTSRTLPSQTSS